MAKNMFAVPLAHYSMKEDKLSAHNIKYLLKNHNISDGGRTGKKIELWFDIDDFYKALLGDIEYFYSRALVQYANLARHESSLSPDWLVVTEYYFGFFSATALMRFFRRGNLWIDNNTASYLSDVLTIIAGEKIAMTSGNYSFTVEEYTASQVLLSLTQSKDSHVKTWNQVNDILQEMIKLGSGEDDEFTVLTSLKQILNREGCTFPSVVRNKVNYQGVHGVDTMKNAFPQVPTGVTLARVIKGILKYDGAERNNLQEQINLSVYYSHYLFALVSKLYEESAKHFNKRTNLSKRRTEYYNRHGVAFPMFDDFMEL